MPASLCPGKRSRACDCATVPVPSCHCANQSVLCLCQRARAIVPVPEPSCLRHRACAIVPVPMCLCQGHRACAIMPAPFCPCNRSAEPSCQRQCHRARAIVPCHCARAIVPGPTFKHSNRVIDGVARLLITRDKPCCQHRFRHQPIKGAALLALLPPRTKALSG